MVFIYLCLLLIHCSFKFLLNFQLTTLNNHIIAQMLFLMIVTFYSNSKIHIKDYLYDIINFHRPLRYKFYYVLQDDRYVLNHIFSKINII